MFNVYITVERTLVYYNRKSMARNIGCTRRKAFFFNLYFLKQFLGQFVDKDLRCFSCSGLNAYIVSSYLCKFEYFLNYLFLN